LEVLAQPILEDVDPTGVIVLEVLMNQEAARNQTWKKDPRDLNRQVFIFHCIHQQDLDWATSPLVEPQVCLN
jgi:hypothetical protein